MKRKQLFPVELTQHRNIHTDFIPRLVFLHEIFRNKEKIMDAKRERRIIDQEKRRNLFPQGIGGNTQKHDIL